MTHLYDGSAIEDAEASSRAIKELQEKQEGQHLEIHSMLDRIASRKAALRSVAVQRPKNFEDQISRAETPQTFTQFPQLSTEIRLMIWRYVASQGRIVNVSVDSPPFGAWIFKRTPHVLPAVLAVHSEARAEARKHYITIRCPHRLNLSCIYFNPQHDTLRLQPYGTLGNEGPLFKVLKAISETHNGTRVRALAIDLDYLWTFAGFSLLPAHQNPRVHRFIFRLTQVGVGKITFIMPSRRQLNGGRDRRIEEIRKSLLEGWEQDQGRYALPEDQKPMVSFELITSFEEAMIN